VLHFRAGNNCSVYLKAGSVILTRIKSPVASSHGDIYLGDSLSLPSELGISGSKFFIEVGILAFVQINQTVMDV